MSDAKTPHILTTSSNLLGFCFLIITSLKISNKHRQTTVDEVLTVAALIFMTSTLLSFISIRSRTEGGTQRYERLADWFFVAGLVLLFAAVLLISYELL